jgi:HEAT repeat protein
MFNSTIPIFDQLLQALVEDKHPLPVNYMYALSDLSPEEISNLEHIWPKISLRRRRSMLEDLEDLTMKDYILSFEAVFRLALNDSDSQVRTIAIRTLMEFPHSDLIPIFMELLHTDEHHLVRAASATALGTYVFLGELEELPQNVAREVEECLLRTVRGEEHHLVRRRALEALGYSSNPEVSSLIEEAYFSDDEDWLVSALCAMGSSANTEWQTKILSMLDHPSPAIRLEAIRAAGTLELDSARAELLPLLNDPNSDIRLAAAWSLSQIGGQGVRRAIGEVMDRTWDEEEFSFLMDALDNLAFTEDLLDFPLIDWEDDGEYHEIEMDNNGAEGETE